MRTSLRPSLRGSLLAILIVVTGSGITPAARVEASAGPHWIATRTAANGYGELYDTRTGATFRPRGFDLLHDHAFPNGAILDMIVAPGWYDQAWVDQQLDAMASRGYTTIRVFLDLCPVDCLTNPDGTVKAGWLDNVAALLESARARGMVILFTSNQLPETGYADHLPCCSPFGGGFNSQFLTGEGVNLSLTYWRRILVGLVDRGAPLEAVLAWELVNEAQFEGQYEPLSLTSGLVTTANGRTYDMSSPQAKIDMVDEGLTFWADRVRETIRAIDPTALVTMGFFPPDFPHSVRPGDTRVVQTKRFIRESTMDFFDFHFYPSLDLYLWQAVENFSLDATITKPVLLGEFGSIVPAHPDGPAAGVDLVGTQAASCPFGFDGWLNWVWGSLDPSIIKATDDGFAIANALAPTSRPDPCAPPASKNLAFQRPVVVDSELPGEPGSQAVDGLVLTDWNAGAPPPITITIDLGSPQTIHEIRLLTAQFPAGTTTHRIEVRKPVGGWLFLAKLSGYTQGDQWLRVFPSSPVTGVRWIRIRTQKSPSWVSWREIQAY
jgi:hypothetical protein